MQLCKRIRTLCLDESLWQKINLSWISYNYPWIPLLPCSFIQFLISKKCQSLDLEGSTVSGRPIELSKNSQLRHLNLGKSKINKRILYDLLSSCYCLESLSLLFVKTPANVIKKICRQNGKTLKERKSNFTISPLHIHTIMFGLRLLVLFKFSAIFL